MEILDYSDIIDWNSSSGYSKKSDTISSIFSKPKNICAYCNLEMTTLHGSWENLYAGSTMGVRCCESQLFYCTKCGWWNYLNTDYADLGDRDHPSYYTSRKPILRVLDSSSSILPLSVLEQEFQKNPSVLASINPTKMEEFVKYIFEGFYKCEVIHCGKSGDKGIDLIVINSDNPIAVQVKRRSNINSKEQIKNVREFIGALTVNNYRHGIYVTTSNDFTKQTCNEVSSVLNNRHMDYFELINFDKLSSIFNLVKKENLKPWDGILVKYSNVTVDIDFSL
jgi:hypothetical protein